MEHHLTEHRSSLWSREREGQEGSLEVFYLGVSSAGTENCNEKQREVTLHKNSHPGKAKRKGRKVKETRQGDLNGKSRWYKEKDASKG